MEKFYALSNDLVFKRVFEDNELMKILLNQCLEEEVEILEYKPTEKNIDSIKERNKRLDLVIKLKGRIINVEVNTSYDNEKTARNFSYLCKLHSENINKTNAYALQEESMQINFNLKTTKDRSLKETYIMYNPNKKEALKVKFVYVDINLDKYKLLWYDKNEKEIKKNSMIVALSITDKKELDSYVSYVQDESIRKVRDKVIYINEDGDYVSELSWQERMEIEKKQEINFHTHEAKKASAKKLLELNTISIDDIAKVTELSVEEINTIKSNLLKEQ